MRIVMKFGGTGVDSCQNLIKVSDLVTNYKNDSGYEIVVVVSAVRGVTDSILKLTDSINRHEKVSVQDILGKLSKTHLEIIEGCIHDTELRDLARDTIIKLLNELKDVLGGMVILQEVTPKSLDYLLSFGERLSASMVYFALRDKGVVTECLTGKEVGIMTDSNFGVREAFNGYHKVKSASSDRTTPATEKRPNSNGFHWRRPKRQCHHVRKGRF